ncbi:MAG: hypothetical protein ACTHMG_02280 [Sphingomonas sp.]
MTFDEAVDHALTLTDTVSGTHYGGPAVKVASNGRAFLSRGHEPQEAFCLALDRDTIELLKESDPATFFQTPHYVGWDAVLVRYDSPDPDRVCEIIARSRDYVAAKKPTRPRK